MKDSLRIDPRYKSVKHEDREALFNEYLSELKAAEQEVARLAKAKHDEEVRILFFSNEYNITILQKKQKLFSNFGTLVFFV